MVQKVVFLRKANIKKTIYREEYSEDEIGNCIVILSTFVNREPGMQFKLIFTCSTAACLLYISTRVWVLRTPNAGRNSHFQCFYAANLLLFCSFSAFQKKMLKITILTSAAPKCWSKYTTAQSQDKFLQELIIILIIEQR